MAPTSLCLCGCGEFLITKTQLGHLNGDGRASGRARAAAQATPLQLRTASLRSSRRSQRNLRSPHTDIQDPTFDAPNSNALDGPGSSHAAGERRDEELFAGDDNAAPDLEDDDIDAPTYADDKLEPWREGLTAEEMVDLDWELEVMDACNYPFFATASS